MLVEARGARALTVLFASGASHGHDRRAPEARVQAQVLQHAKTVDARQGEAEKNEVRA
jgi:hypothetical protein